MQIDDLKKSENEHLVDFWITDKAAAMKDGTVVFTQYHDFGGGSFILRSALEPGHPESPTGLAKRANAKQLVVNAETVVEPIHKVIHHGRYGKLALEYCKVKLPITVLKSARGYYIGTASEELGHVSRESDEYFLTEAGARAALETGNWTQREEP
jgi:hypothetical protein